MTYLVRFVLFFLLLYASYQETYAYTFEVNGIYYRTTSSTECEVTYKKDYSGEIVIPSSVQYGSESFSVTAIGDSAFWRCNKVNYVTIPNSIITIGDHAFQNSTITLVNIPNSVTYIGKYAFASCDELTSISLPNSITTIEEWSFCGLWKLHSLTIPHSVTTIKKFAFQGCSSIDTLIIGSNVKFIEEYAFNMSRFVQCVYCYAATPPEATYAFYDPEYGKANKLMIGQGTVLHVPASSVDIYKETFPWSQFNYIETFGTNYKEKIIGNWKLVTNRNFSHTNVIYHSNNTFVYTSTDNPSYQENGRYEIYGGILYEYFHNNVCTTSRILLINNMSLVLQEDEDGIPYGKPYAYTRIDPDPPADINPLLIGKWELTYPSGAVHTHLEFEEDRTFKYTSTKWSYYYEEGKFRVEEDLLYQLFYGKDDWSYCKILNLTETSLTLGEIDDDYITVCKEYKYKKVSGSSGIDSPASIPEINTIYSIEGIKNATLQKGINIIKMNDGTIKKVLIK